MYGNYNNTVIKMYPYCLNRIGDVRNYYSLAFNKPPHYFKDNVLLEKLFSD